MQVDAGLENLPLLDQSDFTVDGGFCLPDLQNPAGGNGGWVDYAPIYTFAFDPADGTVWTSGGAASGGVVQLTIPALVTSSSPAALNKATFVASQPNTDPTEGQASTEYKPGDSIANTLQQLTALLPWGSLICGTSQYYYQSTANSTYPFYCRPKDLEDTGHVQGMMAFSLASFGGTVSERMTDAFCLLIPSQWQSVLGGPAACGAGATYSIIETGQSYGPDLFILDPDDIATGGTATGLIYYPVEHQTLGGWDTANWAGGEMMDIATQITGGAIIKDTRTTLFFGTAGNSDYACYGHGTTNVALHGTPHPEGEVYCYDPAFPGVKANHAYPYNYRVWAVDTLDLVRVKNGEMLPWEIVPYGFWIWTFPIDWTAAPADATFQGRGMTYDAVNQKLFIGQGRVCSGHNAAIWRYSINTTP